MIHADWTGNLHVSKATWMRRQPECSTLCGRVKCGENIKNRRRAAGALSSSLNFAILKKMRKDGNLLEALL